MRGLIWNLILLAIGLVILSANGLARAQDEIPGTPLEAVAWLESQRNSVKRNEQGEVVEIVIDYVPKGFAVGDLEIFPRLEILEINYTGEFYDHHMSGIAKLKNLKCFVVDYCDEISDATLSVLHYLPDLKEVKLRHCDAVFSLESLSECHNLQKLDLTYNEHLDFKQLASLEQFSHLESLVLRENPGLEDQHLELIGKLRSLKEIDISQCQNISDQGLAFLSQLEIIKLNLSGCAQIQGGGFSAFRPQFLRELDLSSCSIDDLGLGELGKFSQLEALLLSGNLTIEGEGLSVLSQFPVLKRIDLAGLPVENKHVESLNTLTTLTSVNLQECTKISGQGLAGLKRSAGLESLNLSGCRRLDAREDFEVISELSALRKLNVSETRIKPESVPLLKKLRRLEKLDLSGCKWIDDASMADVSKIENLKVLRLDDVARLTDQSLERLAESKGLERLYLGRNHQLSGEGFAAFPDSANLQVLELVELENLSAKALANLPRFGKLSKLVINSVRLTDDHIRAMRGIPNLRELDLDDTSDVDDTVLHEFKNSLPKLED